MDSYLASAIKQFQYAKSMADKSFAQLSDEQLHWQPNEASNSIAIIVKHMAGNMLSRWTDFLTSDGEKSWRNRESEFEDTFSSREEMLAYWEKGWACLFDAIEPLSKTDLERVIYIRNQGHTVVEAINRQLAHYSYHVGQIVYLARLITDQGWKSLSIPKGGSEAYNAEKFSQEKQRQHFTDDFK
jgi:uncharacterized damage-inducible protein DinB